MSSVNADQYFDGAPNKGKAVPVLTAQRVQPGDTVDLTAYVGSSGNTYSATTAYPETIGEACWHLADFRGGRLYSLDEGASELAPKALSAGDIQRLDFGTTAVRSVAKGEPYYWGKSTQAAPMDGYAVDDVDSEYGGEVFFSAALYGAMLEGRNPDESHMLIASGDPVEYVILTEEVTLNFAGITDHLGKPGMVLFKEDGYVVITTWVGFLSKYVIKTG